MTTAPAKCSGLGAMMSSSRGDCGGAAPLRKLRRLVSDQSSLLSLRIVAIPGFCLGLLPSELYPEDKGVGTGSMYRQPRLTDDGLLLKALSMD